MKILIITLMLFIPLFAQDADVLALRGYISLDGEVLEKGMKLTKGGTIKTGVGSYVRLRNNATKSIIIVGPNSEMEINLKAKDLTKQNVLQKGLARWVSEKVKDESLKNKQRGLSTRQAVMGVRGTDYIVKVTPLFQETEIIVMDGSVQFDSKLNSKDQKLIKKHQWGGLGGRFGSNIGDLIDLPKAAIDYFDNMIPNI